MLAFSSLNSICKYQDCIFYEVIINIIIIIIIKFFASIELLVYSNVFKTPIWKRMLSLRQIDNKIQRQAKNIFNVALSPTWKCKRVIRESCGQERRKCSHLRTITVYHYLAKSFETVPRLDRPPLSVAFCTTQYMHRGHHLRFKRFKL